MSIVFPCPNCGASQNVNDSDISTQCQFCGNTIAVPESLRPKNTAPAAAPAMPQALSFAGLTGFPGMGGMPLNLDINKLRDLGHAVRAGDQAQAAQLYQDIFGVGQTEAQQMVEAMLSHHGVVISQLHMDMPPIVQLGSMPPIVQLGSNPPNAQWGGPPPGAPATPSSMPGYVTPSAPMIVTGQRSGGRGAACLTVAFILFIGIVVAGAILAAVLLSTPGLLNGIINR